MRLPIKMEVLIVCYNTKNYTEQGGEVTHIGGMLQFDDGAGFSGFPGAENQAVETPSNDTVAKVRASLNALIVRLKNAGIMIPDAWNLSVRLAPSLTDAVAAANNAKASVVMADNVITVTADVDALEESASSKPGQGTHKWIGLGIGTGLSSVTLAKYNGAPLTADDAAEAASVGLNRNGEFILYIKAEVVAENGYSFTLDADGYAPVTIAIRMAKPAASTTE